MSVDALLSVRDLHVHFAAAPGERVHAVRGVSFDVQAGRTLALVGESGCGKSASCLALMRLLPTQATVTGQVLFAGQDLLALKQAELDALRGGSLAMVFQDPSNALNPVHTVGAQVIEALRLHRGLRGAAARAEAVRLLERVGIAEPVRRLAAYPHQLSGGLNQRVMIAMALAGQPRLLIADEPTTALDATVQTQILVLLRELQAQTGMALVLITHDLGVVAEMADEVAVLYAGQVVEHATVHQLFDGPAHPYSEGLLASLPRIDQVRESLLPIEGSVPAPTRLPPGCSFEPRCRHAQASCRAASPTLTHGSPRAAACFHPLAA